MLEKITDCERYFRASGLLITDGRMTDARMDERTEKIMLLSHTFTMRGSDVASLVEFRLVV